MIGIANR